MSFVRPSIDSTVSIDAAATYYQDPEARMKLRKYLASPQKFDEAVAFGFPSLPARTSVVEKDLLRTPHSTSGNDAQRFLREDTLQFVDRYSSDSSDDDTLSYNESPVTPADSEDAMPRSKPYGASIFAGLERTEMPSLKFQFEGLSEMEMISSSFRGAGGRLNARSVEEFRFLEFLVKAMEACPVPSESSAEFSDMQVS